MVDWSVQTWQWVKWQLDCDFIQPLCDHIDRLATIHNYNNLYGARLVLVYWYW